MISDLTIQPTAAYLLAAPSAPDEARQQAIERAEKGEEITTSVAKEILAETRKKCRPRRQKAVPTVKLSLRVMNVLEKYKRRWNPDELSELARQLREFADALEKPKRGGKKRAGGVKTALERKKRQSWLSVTIKRCLTRHWRTVSSASIPARLI